MLKREILDEAKRDLRAARWERDISIPAVLGIFVALSAFVPSAPMDYFLLVAVAMLVYCLMSIRTAIHACAVRNLMALVDNE